MEIKPFKAFRYNPDIAGNPGDCAAPPYDVIDTAQQEKLYQLSPYNIVRITRGKVSPSDTEKDNQYTRAAQFFNGWIRNKVLKRDDINSIYACVQDFQLHGRAFRRSGFIALARLEEFGSRVQPHEKTLDAPKADRLKLLQAADAQFGQVFMLYDDRQKIAEKIMAEAAKGKPLVDFVDDDDARHRLFQISDTNNIEAIQKMMSDKSGVIADGHHRYETALNYYRQTGRPSAGWQMMTFVNMRNEGLIILPTHRLVNGLNGFDAAGFLRQLEAGFQIQSCEFADSLQKDTARNTMFAKMRDALVENKNAFGIYTGSSRFYVLVLKDRSLMTQAMPHMSDALKALDVSVLHCLILEKALGIGDEQLACESHIEYIKDINQAVDKAIKTVDNGKAQVLFFMNPTKIEQVKAVAAAGEKMPQKSTFFYPKVFSGLTINRL
ncbi:MAG: DUF1015 domain-containing protein [Planctomycetota bacterium]